MESRDAISALNLPFDFTSAANLDVLTYISATKKLKLQANAAPTISSGAVAPASTPGKIGDIYVDTVAKKLYFAAGTTNSSDWIIAN